MRGWILYKRRQEEISSNDHGITRLLSAAIDLNMDIRVVNPSELCLISGNNAPKTMILDGSPIELPDFIFPRMGAESTHFALSLIRHLELAGVYSANSAATIELVKDKMRVSQLLSAANLPNPKSILLNNPIPFEQVEEQIGFPLVMKHISSARGIGVHLCETMNSFRDLLGLFPEQSIPCIMVQKYISTSYGRDLRVFVIDSEVVGCMQRKAKEGFKANYSLGGTVEPYPLNTEIRDLALACTKVTGLDIAGIDLLFDENGHFTICEANSAPGFKGMEAATHDDLARKILAFIHRKLS